MNVALQMNDMNDIISDFSRFKVSALKKASRISSISCSPASDRITIGPQSVLDKDESNKLENIENEQNSCNIKTPPKTSNSPKYNTISTSNGIHFSMKKILLESELQRQEQVRVINLQLTYINTIIYITLPTHFFCICIIILFMI